MIFNTVLMCAVFSTANVHDTWRLLLLMVLLIVLTAGQALFD